jgi:predicted aspartyl protease
MAMDGARTFLSAARSTIEAMWNTRAREYTRRALRTGTSALRESAWFAVFATYLALISAAAQTNQPIALAEVPLKSPNGDLLVEARINGSEPLLFKIDTGFGITTINPNRVESLHLERVGQMTIIGIAGEEQADTYAKAVFDFGGATYSPRRVASLPSDARRRWRKRDGILGEGFFRRFVVELDVAKQRLRLYEPKTFEYHGSGEIIPISFKRDTPIIDATITPEGKGAIAGRFEIDTGCDGELCLGHEFVAANHLLEESDAGQNETRRGVGGGAQIRTGILSELRIGKLIVKKPTANFFLEGSPAGDGQAGHIGLGVLERYKMIFDYSRLRLILEPNPGTN